MKRRLLITWLVALGLILAAEVETAIREHAHGHGTSVREEVATRPTGFRKVGSQPVWRGSPEYSDQSRCVGSGVHCTCRSVEAGDNEGVAGVCAIGNQKVAGAL